jgi:hypothetical protein
MRFLLLLSVIASGATIDQYLGAPFASELHAAPGGGRVVWLLNERGARNLWGRITRDGGSHHIKKTTGRMSA